MKKKKIIIKSIIACIFIICLHPIVSCNKSIDIPEEENGEDFDSLVQTPWEFDTPFSFDLPSINLLRSSEKKVFAHYFTQFPLSIDNKNSNFDYYTTGYLSPGGESNKHYSYGGYLRSRPLPREPNLAANWMEMDMEEEVKRAISIGLDGFTCDLLSFEGYHLDRVIMLLEAAERVDSDFKIVLMPDMEALKTNDEKIADLIKILSTYSAALRLNDGRLIVSPYNAQIRDVAWWKNWLDEMKSQGIDIAFFPLFQDWERYASDFAEISYGMSDWGWSSVNTQSSWVNVPKRAKSYGPIWMMPVRPQDMRPREFRYWEAGNSAQYRMMWENAIKGDADWVQLITWNDYAEHTVIAPSTGTQYSFFDLTAYYVTWFKTGVEPEIERDVLYYFYRPHTTSLTPEKQEKPFKLDNGSDPSSDQIELLALLTSPGTLEIEIGNIKKKMDGVKGINVFKVPMKEGYPIFRLIRNNETITTLPGAFKIDNKIDFQNLMYYGGSSSRMPVNKQK